MTDFWPFGWSSSSRCEIGNVRKVNEDACVDNGFIGLWAVADGMGGHQSGDLASRMVVDSLSQIEYVEYLDKLVDEVKNRLSQVNNDLIQEATNRGINQTIGTTVVVFLANQEHCAFLWAGDSRLYRLRSDSMTRMTKDHSHVQELIEFGVLDPDEAESHPAANVITRAVGANEPLKLDVEKCELLDGDIYMLCSDGLYKELSEDEIAAIVKQNHDSEDICRSLVDTALDRQGRDNITVVVIQIYQGEKTELRGE